MGLITIEPASSTGLGWISRQSRTMCVPGAAATVQSRIAQASGGNAVVTPLRGLGEGAFETVPTWAWWAGGGLLVGLLGTAVVLKLKKRKH